MPLSPAKRRELKAAIVLWLWGLVVVLLLDIMSTNGLQWWPLAFWTGLCALYIAIWWLHNRAKWKQSKTIGG